jgi:hypothetical protein
MGNCHHRLAITGRNRRANAPLSDGKASVDPDVTPNAELMHVTGDDVVSR